MTTVAADRRLAWGLVGGAVAVFLALYLVHRPTFETPDEAKYIGLGLNILTGRGLVTDFGVAFLNHPPVWPLAMALPRQLLGLDALGASHVIEAVAAAAVIALAAALAGRIRPAAAAVTAAVLLASPYLASLSRTAGIDLPATAFALAFLFVADRATASGSVRAAALAGALFGVAFLIKETAIPFAVVPFAAAAIVGRPAAAVARTAAAALLAALVVCGWWFVVYAAQTGSIYRVGGPAWLLWPASLAVAVAIGLGLAAPRLAGTARLRSWQERLGPTRAQRLLAVLGWLALVGWLVAQLVAYAHAAKLGGAALVRPSQLAADARSYLPQIGLMVGYGVAGLVAAALILRRSAAAVTLGLAAIAQAPLMLLVLGIGETPRHYIATLVLLIAVGSCGWLALLERATQRDRGWRWSATLAVLVGAGFVIALPDLLRSRTLLIEVVVAIGLLVMAVVVARLRPDVRLVRRVAIAPAGLVAALVGGLVLGGTDAAHVARAHTTDAEAQAIGAISAWLPGHVPAGSTVMVGPALAYEIALAAHGQQTVNRLRPQSALPDPTSPTGLRAVGAGVIEPVELDTALRNVDELDAYAPAAIEARIAAVRPAAWIEAQYVPRAAAESPVFALFDATHGMQRLQSWQFPTASRELVVVAYAIDPASFAIPDARLYAEPAAIETLARLLGARPGGGAAAQALLARLQPVPPGASADAAMAHLRAVGGD